MRLDSPADGARGTVAPMRRLLVLLVAFTLFAAACGGDDGGSDDASAGDAAAEGSSDGEGSGDGDDAEGDEPNSIDADGDEQADLPTGEGLGSDFCDFVDEQEETSDIDPVASPEELEEWFRDAYEAVGDARELAPDEISEDMELAYEQYGEFIDLMEESGWDFMAVDENDPRATLLAESAVFDRLEAYCDDGTADTPAVPSEADLQNLDPGDEDAFAIQLFTAMGHDQETAECLVDELGADFDLESAGADVMSQEFCGLTVLEIFAFGG